VTHSQQGESSPRETFLPQGDFFPFPLFSSSIKQKNITNQNQNFVALNP
jgi:hypothetical protein